MNPLTHEGQFSEHLSSDDLLQMYWYMLLSRRVDERAWVLHRQGKIPFHISGIGHEALQVAAAFALNRGVDYTYPYYRDLAFVLTIGYTPLEFMLGLFGKEGEPSSGGRQMPSHWSHRDINIVTQSAVVATQVPQAAGTAFAINYRLKQGLQDPSDTSQPRLAMCSLGEGSTTQGEWHEGLNWAGVHQLPFICIVENNNYAISVPYEKQSAVSVAERAESYGVTGIQVDGTDPIKMYEVMKAAVERAYSGQGPTCIEAKCHRLVPHSSDDDDRTYRSKEELQAIKEFDPVPNFRKRLLDDGILTEALDNEYEDKAKQIVNDAHRTAEAAPYPNPADHLSASHTFAPDSQGDF
ncbi:MAG: thiamine pyrophosphate-dependent dehydrogenase E1 component subunit alpha [Phototrophicaceae bacterium]